MKKTTIIILLLLVLILSLLGDALVLASIEIPTCEPSFDKPNKLDIPKGKSGGDPNFKEHLFDYLYTNPI